MTIPVLTIDGPSGAGKGTVSREVAKLLDWNYLDSGSIYRSLAIALSKAGIGMDDHAAICQVGKSMALEFLMGDDLLVRLDGENITAQLVLESTGKMASMVAVIPEVRQVLLQKQKAFQRPPGLVADGRDMGSIVFPEAEFKVYLTASSRERARRRYKQLIEKGIHATLSQVVCEIEERDRRDSERAASPLVVPEGSYYIDSSNISIGEVVSEIMKFVRVDEGRLP